VDWFRKPAIAGSTVLLILFLGWISSKFFLSSPLGSEEMHLKNTFVRLFSQHASLLNQIPPQVEAGSEKLAINEFQWSLKRVIFAIQRESALDKDIAQDLSQVLQNTAVLIGAQKSKSGELNM
jgi:hypothetical protein